MVIRGMRRFGPLVVGVVEIFALVVVSGWIGFGRAILLLLATSVAGLALLRFEGFRAWASLRDAAVAQRDQQVSGDAVDAEADLAAATSKMADTGVRVLAGVCLTVPGFVTDLFAVVLLIPPVRRSLGQRLSAAAFRTFPAPEGKRPSPGPSEPGIRHQPVVIEGEVVSQDRGYGSEGS